MKLSGSLSASAFKSFAAGFEGRAVDGMQAENTRYMRPRDVKWLKDLGLLPALNVRATEGVISHYVRLRSRKGVLSRRMHSLLALFLKDGRVKLLVVPTDWFLVGGNEGEEEPKLKDCSYDICMTRGKESKCETNTIKLPETENCPDKNSGCPNTPCSGGGGSSGFDAAVILAG